MASEILKSKKDSEKFTEESISKILGKLNSSQQNDITRFVDEMYAQKEMLANEIADIAKKRKEEKNEKGKSLDEELEKKRNDKTPVIITFDELKTESYKTEATEKLVEILNKISNFISGDTKNKLVDVMKAGMNNINVFYKEFLLKSTTALFSAIKGVSDIFFTLEKGGAC